MIKTNTNMTFRFALSVLESHFDSVYRGIKTVAQMSSESFLDSVMWENESPDKVYHQFETVVGNNRIVAEDQVIPLAQSIFELSTTA